jgi:hypothetical protein
MRSARTLASRAGPLGPSAAIRRPRRGRSARRVPVSRARSAREPKRRRGVESVGVPMLIYLFRDESDSEVFAFSLDPTGASIPPITPLTEWIFLEALDTLKFPDQWDIDDFQDVLDHLKTDGFYLFQGELLDVARVAARPPGPQS